MTEKNKQIEVSEQADEQQVEYCMPNFVIPESIQPGRYTVFSNNTQFTNTSEQTLIIVSLESFIEMQVASRILNLQKHTQQPQAQTEQSSDESKPLTPEQEREKLEIEELRGGIAVRSENINEYVRQAVKFRKIFDSETNYIG